MSIREGERLKQSEKAGRWLAERAKSKLIIFRLHK